MFVCLCRWTITPFYTIFNAIYPKWGINIIHKFKEIRKTFTRVKARTIRQINRMHTGFSSVLQSVKNSVEFLFILLNYLLPLRINKKKFCIAAILKKIYMNIILLFVDSYSRFTTFSTFATNMELWEILFTQQQTVFTQQEFIKKIKSC